MSAVQVELPQGLSVVGDAATCFNPIYGQGMTVGIKGAILLRDTLQKRLQGRKFSASEAPSILSGFSKARQWTAPVFQCAYLLALSLHARPAQLTEPRTLVEQLIPP